MTTLTQSYLDLWRRRAHETMKDGISFWLQIPAETLLSILDHIAQLTAERDEALARAGKAEADKPQRSMFIDGWFTQEHERQARIAELEAQPSAPPAIKDPHVCNNDDRETGLSWFIGSSRIEIMVDDEAISWCVKNGDKYSSGKIPIPIHSSAQFVAGMRRAAEIARNACLVPPDGGEPTEDEARMCNLCADAILAEAAMKGK